jgi:hypothetical protein
MFRKNFTAVLEAWDRAYPQSLYLLQIEYEQFDGTRPKLEHS